MQKKYNLKLINLNLIPPFPLCCIAIKYEMKDGRLEVGIIKKLREISIHVGLTSFIIYFRTYP